MVLGGIKLLQMNTRFGRHQQGVAFAWVGRFRSLEKGGGCCKVPLLKGRSRLLVEIRFLTAPRRSGEKNGAQHKKYCANVLPCIHCFTEEAPCPGGSSICRI